MLLPFLFTFFFNDTATTEIYTLSLHDALPISPLPERPLHGVAARRMDADDADVRDRKSTRLNSSHVEISYAVFCLKKKKKTEAEVALMSGTRDQSKIVNVEYNAVCVLFWLLTI